MSSSTFSLLSLAQIFFFLFSSSSLNSLLCPVHFFYASRQLFVNTCRSSLTPWCVVRGERNEAASRHNKTRSRERERGSTTFHFNFLLSTNEKRETLNRCFIFSSVSKIHTKNLSPMTASSSTSWRSTSRRTCRYEKKKKTRMKMQEW